MVLASIARQRYACEAVRSPGLRYRLLGFGLVGHCLGAAPLGLRHCVARRAHLLLGDMLGDRHELARHASTGLVDNDHQPRLALRTDEIVLHVASLEISPPLLNDQPMS